MRKKHSNTLFYTNRVRNYVPRLEGNVGIISQNWRFVQGGIPSALAIHSKKTVSKINFFNFL